MRIIMFCPQFRPLIGGSERQAEKLAVALAEGGCHVRILTPRIDPSSPEREESHGVTIERFALSDLARRYPVHGIAILNIPYILFQIVREVRARLCEADVLHCHIASLESFGAALAGRMVGLPVVCKAAMADHRSDLGEIEKYGASGRFIAWLLRILIPKWVATTAAVKSALVRAGVEPGKIVCVPNGVNVLAEVKSAKPARMVRRFIYLGRLSTNTHRDIPTLINAFDSLAKTNPDVELGIVGGGDLFEETRQLARSSNAREQIHLPGFDASDKWLTWADCFVLPSRREGLSNALLEAMAAGLPCIANDIPPNREVLADGKAGILVPIGDVNALREAMREMVNSNGIAAHYGQKAKERASECYRIDVIAQRYLSLYRNLATRVVD